MKDLDHKHSPAGRTGCLLLVQFTVATVIANLIFTGICFISLKDLQSEVATLKEHQAAAKAITEKLTSLLSESEGGKEKRSAASLTSSSQLASDIGSLVVSTIRSICLAGGAVCITGSKGEAGRDGLPGKDGVGWPGANGFAGRDGLPGQDGMPGRDGEKGNVGEPGLPGMKGDKGDEGVKGDVGEQGVKGIQGKGNKGERGYPGRTGAKGDTGEQGKRGRHGSKGSKGTPGEKGMTGTKGNKGSRGEKGMKGGKGMKGEKGDNMKQDIGLPSQRNETNHLPSQCNKTNDSPSQCNETNHLPSQCHERNHRVLSDTWRKVSSYGVRVGFECDFQRGSKFQPGWHVFAPNIGGKMPEECPDTYHCGTAQPGWLNGSHPTTVGQTSTEMVCFHWMSNCCKWDLTVDITNCGKFYVYNLPIRDGSMCSAAYCSDA